MNPCDSRNLLETFGEHVAPPLLAVVVRCFQFSRISDEPASGATIASEGTILLESTMAMLFESLTTGLLIVLLTLIVYIYRSYSKNFDYWEKRDVPFCKPTPLFGNFKDRLLFRKTLGEIWLDLYNELKGHKLGGVWLVKKPILFLRDPEVIKRVLVKDFSYFQGRGASVDEKKNPLGAHLNNLSGQKWRSLRAKLTPTFTSGKMKLMFPLMNECAQEMIQFVTKETEATGEIEVKEAFSKFTTEVIGTCAFGLQCNAIKDPDSEFRTMGRKAFTPSSPRTLVHVLSQVAPWLLKYFRSSSPTERVDDFFLKVIDETVKYREENNVSRNDFLQLLIELKNKGKVEEDGDSKISENGISQEDCDLQGNDEFVLTNELLAAQAHVFFLAGFETSSTTMSFALHELAVNPDVQEKVRSEVDSVLKESGGELTYEGIQKMVYLDKVINETLRKYPPVSVLVRLCNENYCEPDTDVLIEKGMQVQIPVYALHHDPVYYPQPERFDPERFTEEEKAKRPSCVFLPFGDGPKMCIGIRFGMLQMKLGLAALVSRFELAPSARTPHPLQLDPRGCVIACRGGVWARLAPRAAALSKDS